jgi:hypothetical protein
MRESYDFSHGQRDKFHHPNGEFELPIRLDRDIIAYLHRSSVRVLTPSRMTYC